MAINIGCLMAEMGGALGKIYNKWLKLTIESTVKDINTSLYSMGQIIYICSVGHT